MGGWMSLEGLTMDREKSVAEREKHVDKFWVKEESWKVEKLLDELMKESSILEPLYLKFKLNLYIYIYIYIYIHSFSSLSYDRSKASSKASSPHSAIQSFLFQMRVSSPFLKVIK